MKFHNLWLILLFVVVGCNSTSAKLKSNRLDVNQCPILKNENWSARIENSATSKSLFRLFVQGEITFSDSRYQVKWSKGPLDRRSPPKLIINIEPIKSDGLNLQVLTPVTITYSIETKLNEFRAISVYCNREMLTELIDIKLTD